MSDYKIPAPLERRQFASDNYAGICPEAWAALQDANSGHAPAYGEDPWTARACDLLRELFEIDCDVFFAFNGTAANSMSLAAMCQSYHSIICHSLSHVETDECGGPEFFSNGTKVLLVEGEAGKISLDAVRHTVERRTDIHYPKPRVLSVTQATEMGTVYSVEELDAIQETARQLKLRLHMDGARFANAAAALGVAPKEITWKAGIDVLCFGGTKNGMPVGDAVIFFNRELAKEFEYRCKQAGQLASKMRFLAAPWVGMLESGAWLERAGHANRCARMLDSGLRDIDGVELVMPTQANAVFARLPGALASGLRDRGWRFYTFIGSGGVRLMCSWDTTEDDVTAFLNDVRALSQGGAGESAKQTHV
ncbi:MAG: threonine aldolase family protein [Acidiferrobacterales bacterium]